MSNTFKAGRSHLATNKKYINVNKQMHKNINVKENEGCRKKERKILAWKRYDKLNEDGHFRSIRHSHLSHINKYVSAGIKQIKPETYEPIETYSRRNLQ